MLSSTNKNPDLKAYLKLIDEKRKSDGKLIYKKKSVPVSKIIQQLYCEKQLELELIHGERLNLEKKRGKEGHEADLKFLSPVKIEKAWNEATRQNKRKPYKIREFHLLAKYQGFIIEGKADEVSFLRGKVLTLSEFKFRKNKKFGNLITEVRGRGLMLGVEFIEDRYGIESTIRMINNGIFADFCGNNEKTIKLMPPLVINDEDVNEILTCIDTAFNMLSDPK